MASFFSTPYWKQLFGIDLRTLALFRIALALVIIVDICNLWPNAFAFFDDRGLFPRGHAIARRSVYYWSLYYLSGHVAWAYALFTVTVLSALALLFGYRTRLATIVCWVLLASLSTRINIFASGADMQINLLLFWSMFLPLGARFSIDAALCKTPKSTAPVYASMATLALLLQEAYLYFFGALLKNGSAWKNDTALYYSLNSSEINSPFSSLLTHSPELMEWLTAYVWSLEFFAIFLLFSPVRTVLCRLIILPLLVLLHVCIAIFLAVAFFPVVSICGLTVFIPSAVWDKLLPWFNARPQRKNITLYYDRECGFCRKTCLIFRELGLPSATRIEPAQAYPEIYAIMQRENSWVVEDGAGQRRTQWDAVAWCWRRSPLLWPLGAVFLPPFMRPLGDALYRLIAGNRDALGRLTAFFLPEYERPIDRPLRKWTQIIVALLMVLVLLWNISSVFHRTTAQPFPKPVVIGMTVLKLMQSWRLFAPQPILGTQWVVIEGHLRDGQVVDLLHDRLTPPSHKRPVHGYAIYPGHGWHKFFSRIDYARARGTLGRYFCSVWKDRRPSGYPAIEKISLTVYRQRTPKPGAVPIPVKKYLSFDYRCQRARPPRRSKTRAHKE